MALDYHIWRQSKSSNKKLKGMLDNFIYFTSIAAVAMNVPQLIKVWTEKDISGVSIISWGSFFFSSLFWVFYGFVHKSKPIMVLNASVAVVQLFIVIGILTH